MRFLVAIFLICIGTRLTGQELLNIPGNRINRINTINWKDSNINISFFDSVLQKANLLILAEANHGDGSSYDAQCMILKGLIDEGKINTIYTESSWINIDAIVTILKKEGIKSIPETKNLMRSIELRYWVDNGFWEYLAVKIIEGKINLFGFDIGGHSSKIVIPLFDEACGISDVQKHFQKNSYEYNRLRQEYYSYDGWGKQSRYDFEGYNDHKKFIDITVDFYKKTDDSLKVRQWTTILDCFFWMYKRSLVLAGNKYSNVIETDLQNSEFNLVRDSLMAETFYSFFLQSNNSQKAVALMSTYHALRASQSIEYVSDCCINPLVKPMAQILVKKYNVNFFNVAFVAGSGEHGLNYASGNMKYSKIKKPVKGSLEYTLNKLPHEYCVLKLTDVPEKEFYMNVLYDRYLKADWRKNFDAVFFIKEMKPLIFKNLFN